MLEDRFGNALTTHSLTARDAYIDGVDKFLAAEHGVEDAFNSAIAADEHFALAYVGIARSHQLFGKVKKAAEANGLARVHSKGLTNREVSHIKALGLLIDGKVSVAYKAIRSHLNEYPQDAMVAQTCAGVFGLIGFSGQPGRIAEQLAFTTKLLPHYGDDWWFLGQHAFAQVEAGQIGPATETIERSLAGNPRSAHGAHNRTHIYYEAGETETGYNYLNEWRRGYDKGGALHCHLSWHIALWALERGEIDTMWEVIDADVAPDNASGPPLNVLTDNAAFLYRAELAGLEIPLYRWKSISNYAQDNFPSTGNAFVDVHAALAHARADNREALDKIISEAKGPAEDIVRLIAEAFKAISAENWVKASDYLTAIIAGLERIGGSCAQRDLIEYALLDALIKQGKISEANLLLTTRRPLKVQAHAVCGL